MSCEAEQIGALRRAGHKLTPQRMLILRSIRHARGHISASRIHDEVKAIYPFVDISTVYRTLNVLKEMRLISETHMQGTDASFEWVNAERHHHVICRVCDKVVELDHAYLTKLGRELRRDLGFEAELDHFAIFGRCAACASSDVGAGNDREAPSPARHE